MRSAKGPPADSGPPAAAHYLISQQAVVHERRTVADCLTMRLERDGTLSLDSRHANHTLLPLALRDGERALLLSLKWLYVANDTGRSVRFDIDLCFDEININEGQEPRARHPDNSGHVAVHVRGEDDDDDDDVQMPARPVVVPERDTLLYAPNLTNLEYDVLQFAGMEHSIGNARSGSLLDARLLGPVPAPSGGGDRTQGPWGEIFLRTDPFFVFLLARRTKLMWPDEDVRPIEGFDGHYRVAKRTVDRVRGIFMRSVFPLFRYVTADSLRFSFSSPCSGPKGPSTDSSQTLVILFQLEYLVISPGVPRFNDTTTRIKFT